MVWCGYHPDMETGVMLFGQGLIQALSQRAQRENIPFDDLPQIELSELKAFLSQMQIDTGNKTKAMEGLTLLVHSLIEAAYFDSKENGVPFKSALEQKIRDISKLIEPLEVQYQQFLLEDKNMPSPQRMRHLASWLAKQ